MCTFTLAWQALEDAPVAVAANRDERIDRPAVAPCVRDGDPAVVAPRDQRAGGTWIGMNDAGLVAGVTNRWGTTGLTGDRSRGLLVEDVLGCRTTTEAVEVIEASVTEWEYDGFYLAVADEERAVCLGWNGRLERVSFGPGVHVVVNVGTAGAFDVPAERSEFGETQIESVETIETTLAARAGETADEWLERARPLLADHERGVCVHGNGYGTRSSSLLVTGERPRYWYASGPPCETDYEPVSLEGHI